MARPKLEAENPSSSTINAGWELVVASTTLLRKFLAAVFEPPRRAVWHGSASPPCHGSGCSRLPARLSLVDITGRAVKLEAVTWGLDLPSLMHRERIWAMRLASGKILVDSLAMFSSCARLISHRSNGFVVCPHRSVGGLPGVVPISSKFPVKIDSFVELCGFCPIRLWYSGAYHSYGVAAVGVPPPRLGSGGGR